MKFLLWGLIAAAIVVWVLRAKKTLSGLQDSRLDGDRDTLESIEPMVRCAHCGIHLPASESVTGTAGRSYCSEEHHRLENGA